MGSQTNKKPNSFTDAVKMRAVKKAKSGTPVSEIAPEIGCSEASIYTWIAKSEGFDSIAEKRADMPRHASGKANGRLLVTSRTTQANGLPVTAAKVRSVRSRALVATSFECPHCGGAISAPEAVAR